MKLEQRIKHLESDATQEERTEDMVIRAYIYHGADADPQWTLGHETVIPCAAPSKKRGRL